ncbi:MAG: branched-chain amino acid ABC transporter permease [Chloroflexi bacterium]|nr:branched-chain amino acid ABC transporter permease [Chloroflexota bacterium]MDA8188628.1 branched-chain amino acid ABC transporter permease [Dehalococcoidales bacterium]
MEFYQQVLQYLVTGVTLGSIYAIIALGFITIYNVTGIVNFAQGEFVMLGALIAISLYKNQVPIVVAFVGSVMVTTLIGAALQRIAIRPAKGASTLTLIIITIGASITIRGLGLITWGPDPYSLPAFSGDQPIAFGGAAIIPQSFWVFGATIVVLGGLYAFFEWTLLGKAVRACAINVSAARLMGISPSSMALFSFALSAGLGAIGGVVMAPMTLATYDMGSMLALKGFVAAIVGGFTSTPGAVVGGFLIGILESMGAGLISSGYKDAIAFVVLFLVLFLKPNGLFGGRDTGRGGL